MDIKFTARPLMLGMTELQQLSGATPGQIRSLVYRADESFLSEDRVSITVGASLDMMIRSSAITNGVDVQAATAWLPGLRSEALYHLGQNYLNWDFKGSDDAQKQFWPMFYDNPDTVRPRIASLVGCYSTETTRQLRFYTGNDVELLSNAQYDQYCNNRAPRFVIDAHDLASQIQAVCGGKLFFATC